MKLIACIIAYNEAPFIGECLAALHAHGVEAAVLVDGAYRDFPHQGGGASDDGTLDIARAFAGARPGWLRIVGCPPGGWENQEKKRTRYLREADRIAEPGDWWLQVDADEFMVEHEPQPHSGRSLYQFLAEAPANVQTVYVGMRECDGQHYGPYGKLIRWQPGCYYGREHWDILRPDGERLYPPPLLDRDPAARTWNGMKFVHHTRERDDARKGAKGRFEDFRAAYREKAGCMNPNPTSEV